MVVVFVEGNGNWFVVIVVEMFQLLLVFSFGKDCSKVIFFGMQLWGGIEVVDVLYIDGIQMLGVYCVLQVVVGGLVCIGEFYDYFVWFGDYQVIVIVNLLVIFGWLVVWVDM